MIPIPRAEKPFTNSPCSIHAIAASSAINRHASRSSMTFCRTSILVACFWFESWVSICSSATGLFVHVFWRIDDPNAGFACGATGRVRGRLGAGDVFLFHAQDTRDSHGDDLAMVQEGPPAQEGQGLGAVDRFDNRLTIRWRGGGE